MISQGKTVRISYNLTIAGKLVKSVMRLSPVGEIPGTFWGKIPEHFDNVVLDEYVILPC